MELWVRDKSKTVLQKVERVEYNYRNRLHSVMVGLDSIGTYATQERCLEIIDEIQKLLMSGNPENAFIALKDCFFEGYDEIKQIVERARENKFIAQGFKYGQTFDELITEVDNFKENEVEYTQTTIFDYLGE